MPFPAVIKVQGAGARNEKERAGKAGRRAVREY